MQDSLELTAVIALALAACAGPIPARPPSPVAAGPAALAPYEAADPAERLVEQAADSYRNAQFAIAIARANRAEGVLADRWRSSDEKADRALGARAAFIMGCSLAAFGANDQAVAAFSRTRALDPQFEPPPGWLSPRLEKLYRAAGPREPE